MEENCNKYSSCNFPNESKSLYCTTHKKRKYDEYCSD
ncbi:MAG: hypothetical protein ACRCZI_01110 [Cetobacterium sp.]